MDRKGLEQLIFDTYSVEPDYPWMDTPESAVFRHEANRKWFALVTTVPKSKLGLPGQAQLAFGHSGDQRKPFAVCLMAEHRRLRGVHPRIIRLYAVSIKNELFQALAVHGLAPFTAAVPTAAPAHPPGGGCGFGILPAAGRRRCP